MKNYSKYLILVFLLTSVYSEAQYYGNGYGNSGYGRQRNTMPQTNTPQQEPKALTADEIVEQEMPNITETLGLNPFEEAILKTTLTKYVQKRIELQILKLPADKTREAMEKIIKEQDEELKANLSEEQYNAFTELQKDSFKSKKKKKKKKNND